MKKISTIVIAVMMVFLAFFNSEVNGANNYEKEGLPLPNGYPQDLVPLMNGYKIVGGDLGNKGDKKEVWIKYMVDTDIEQAGAFYKDILSKGNLQFADRMGKNLYMLKGEVEGKTVGVNISTEILYDNFQSNVLVSIIGDIETTDEADTQANVDVSKIFKKSLKNMDQVPDGYPHDVVPLYGNEIKYGSKSEYKGKDMFLIQVFSTENKDQVLAVYKEVLKNATKKEEGKLSTGGLTFGGTIENYKVSLVINNTDIAGHEFTSFYTIQVDALE